MNVMKHLSLAETEQLIDLLQGLDLGRIDLGVRARYAECDVAELLTVFRRERRQTGPQYAERRRHSEEPLEICVETDPSLLVETRRVTGEALQPFAFRSRYGAVSMSNVG
jgi:hypothetical protein